jgi:hypothetical protein
MQQILATRSPAPNSGGARAEKRFMSPQNWGLGGLRCRKDELIWSKSMANYQPIVRANVVDIQTDRPSDRG